jgi:hypothetical protein
MPEISRFLGIVIRMFYNDHAPPHFHAEYGDYEVVIEIKTRIADGRFPPHALRAVLDWADIHEQALLANWELAKSRQKPNKIEPLE